MLRQIPNALTLLRGLVMTPAIVVIFLWYTAGNFGLVPPPSEYFLFRSVALLLAALCVASDALDGFLARAYGWRTDFGARVDPLMDKVFSYACLAVIPLYFGFGWYLLWYIA
ncbi:MAG: CDP-alcohol phosphatidyltransferase family protein, partial [Minisyncoccota bacterium]